MNDTLPLPSPDGSNTDESSVDGSGVPGAGGSGARETSIQDTAEIPRLDARGKPVRGTAEVPPGPDGVKSLARQYISVSLDEYSDSLADDDQGPRYAPGAVWAGADPGGRGDLIIENRVAERIAARAALEVTGVSGPPRRAFTAGGTRRTHPPKATARIVDGRAIIRVQVSVHWPAGVRTTTRELRETIERRVRSLTDLEVGSVDIVVVALIDPSAGQALTAPRVR